MILKTLFDLGIYIFPCNENKVPKCKFKHPQPQLPQDDFRWRDGYIGIRVPAGKVVFDIDTYKGVTTDDVDKLLGCKIPWAEALIQDTERGGQHYLLECTWNVRQGSDVHGLIGFDIRSAGKGYICTHETIYRQQGKSGVFAFHESVKCPPLSDTCRPLLENKPRERTTTEGQYDLDPEEVIKALHHIRPDCPRDMWRNTGMAAHHGFEGHEDGLDIWERFSAGEFHGDEVPHNYQEGRCQIEWDSFDSSKEGGIKLETLFHYAIQGGYKPPAKMTAAMAFGANAAPTEAFNDLVILIKESGGDIAQAWDIRDQVTALQGNEFQTATLMAALAYELKENGLLSKDVKKLLESKRTAIMGVYDKNHTENARLFLSNHPNLAHSDEIFYRYENGTGYTALAKNELDRKVAHELEPYSLQASTLNGTITWTKHLVRDPGERIGTVHPDLVLFRNHIRNVRTGEILQHDPKYFTTNVLPYDDNPDAQCPVWDRFVDQVMSGDESKIARLQEMFGYAMLNSYMFHVIFFLDGGLRSGKGTIGHMLQNVLGVENFMGGSLESLASDDVVDMMRTKLVMYMADIEESVTGHLRAKVISRMKSISGNGVVTYSRKYVSALSELLPTLIIMAGNQIPLLKDPSGALASRMEVITLDECFLGQENTELVGQLSQPSEIEGACQWSLRGLERLLTIKKFTYSEDCQKAKGELADQYSPVRAYVRDRLIIDPSTKNSIMANRTVYEDYVGYATRDGETDYLKHNTFMRHLKAYLRINRQVHFGTHVMKSGTQRGVKGAAIGTPQPKSSTVLAFTKE